MVARHQWEQDKMITAAKAKELATSLTNGNAQRFLNEANNQIEMLAKRGATNCSAHIKYEHKSIVNVVTKDLESRGFKVRREQGSDCRNDSWDYLVISW